MKLLNKYIRLLAQYPVSRNLNVTANLVGTGIAALMFQSIMWIFGPILLHRKQPNDSLVKCLNKYLSSIISPFKVRCNPQFPPPVSHSNWMDYDICSSQVPNPFFWGTHWNLLFDIWQSAVLCKWETAG
jgi:hypothetical protein